jgi:hypothetical protein
LKDNAMSRLRLALCMFLFGAAVASGQSFTGRILGTVTDQSGASIPAATVRIVNTGTNAEWHVQTDGKVPMSAPRCPAAVIQSK